jgi:hypothetical protein
VISLIEQDEYIAIAGTYSLLKSTDSLIACAVISSLSKVMQAWLTGRERGFQSKETIDSDVLMGRPPSRRSNIIAPPVHHHFRPCIMPSGMPGSTAPCIHCEELWHVHGEKVPNNTTRMVVLTVRTCINGS